MLPVRIDEVLLQEVAASTGGRYFRAKDSEALSRIFRQIDELERTPVETVRYAQQADLARPILFAALAVLALELLLGATLVVRTP
jgi:Ca-activated chloride channel family protein